MAFKLTIETENAAFWGDGPSADEQARAGEVARILHDIADCLEAGERFTPNYKTLRDINGHDVGRAAFKDNEQTYSTDCKCCA